MSASDWVGRMCSTLEERFDICDDRALRFTTLVRYFVSGEGYEDVLGPHDSDRHRRLTEQLIDDLDESLHKQPGETIEARWNNLMEELDCQARAERESISYRGRSMTQMIGRIPVSHPCDQSSQLQRTDQTARSLDTRVGDGECPQLPSVLGAKASAFPG